MTTLTRTCSPQPATFHRLKTALRALGMTWPQGQLKLNQNRDHILYDARKAYHSLMKQHHGDVGGDAQHHQNLTLAYDAVKRFCRPAVYAGKPPNKRKWTTPAERHAAMRAGGAKGAARARQRREEKGKGMA